MGRVSEARVTEREKKLSKEEKLELINQELLEFMEYCEKNGFSKNDIDKACEPLWRSIENERRRRIAKVVLVFILSAIACTVLFTVNPFARYMAAVGRHLTIKVLPYWDWTQLYYEECLINNPYYEDVKLTSDDCKSCEDFTRIERVSNVTHGLITHEYLYSNIPVIVTDATADWEATRRFTSIRDLYHVHVEDERLASGVPCELISNINIRSADNMLLMSRAMDGDYKKFYAVWQQCDVSPSKAMRAYIPRPYFLPPMVEMVRSNWLFISRHYSGGARYKEIPLMTQLVYLAQIVGTSLVRLEPKPPCDRPCHPLTDTLHPGDTLLFTTNMWNATWLPGDSPTGETIAISTGGYFD